ncbi:unnamed protein product [Bursaphelenchus xylophilus]|uniref:(pine wood nematode) hypothetical protein n=1 Tax=Bursaphelenchus xylophilus TaxID=6326 RepID=A0A1I7S0T1_BURXY|nr:unnamed protein product [Bursaphelenchus xylophilus]CAG9088393.1 unnamed protein product [Bursaphelenchus xylophilus]
MSRSILLLLVFLWTFHQSSAILDHIHGRGNAEIHKEKWPNLDDPGNVFYAALFITLCLIASIMCVFHFATLDWGALFDVLLSTEEDKSEKTCKALGRKVSIASRTVSVTTFDETISPSDDKSVPKKKFIKVPSPKPKAEKELKKSDHEKPPSTAQSTQSVSTAPTIKVPQSEERAKASQSMPASESECFDMRKEEMNAMPPWDVRHIAQQNPRQTKFREAEPLSAEAVYEAKPIPSSLSSSTPREGSTTTSTTKRSPPLSTAREPHSPGPDPEEQP